MIFYVFWLLLKEGILLFQAWGSFSGDIKDMKLEVKCKYSPVRLFEELQELGY